MPSFESAQFLTSAQRLDQCPPDIGAEVAFVGRSNAGKSSAINALTRNGKLARTSKTPGRTQLLNFFALDEWRRLVDLPGYGYAKVSEKIKLVWQANLTHYLQERGCLRGLILLADVRLPLQEFDLNMVHWAQEASLPVHILLTKADKLKRGPAQASLLKTQRDLQSRKLMNATSLQLFSATKRDGLDQWKARLNDWLADIDTAEEITPAPE